MISLGLNAAQHSALSPLLAPSHGSPSTPAAKDSPVLLWVCAWYLSDVCAAAGALQVKGLMAALGEVAGADAGMAYLLWVLVFPIVWATLSENKEQQVQLAKPIIALLSKQQNPRQAAARPNVVQVGV